VPIYEEEGKLTLKDLLDLRRKMKCKECGGMLNVFLDPDNGKAFLACNNWHRTHHEGVAKEARLFQPNIPTRRRIMNDQYGKETTTALDKARLPMTGALTQSQAMHILKLVYPYVPEDEIIRTAILCRDFGLHPLMKEVYIIGFKNNRTGKVDYSTVIGIAANRKMAADKKGPYSFIDLSPRAASKEEIVKQYGADSEEERDNLISICILKGQQGNEAVGFGLWPKDKTPYGTDKGNTKRNMANIRSERQALDRLPGEALPLRHLDVIDEAYAEVPDVGKVDTRTGEIVEGEFKEVEGGPKEHWCKEHNCPFEKKHSRFGDFYAHKKPEGGWCNEAKKKQTTSKAEPYIPESVGDLSSDEPEPIFPEVSEAEAEATGDEVLREQARREIAQQPKRDPDTIKTLNELYKACNEDWGMQPKEVLAEIGVNSQSEISDTPAFCYRKIAAVR